MPGLSRVSLPLDYGGGPQNPHHRRYAMTKKPAWVTVEEDLIALEETTHANV